MDEKSVGNILVFHILYKNLIAKPLYIRFDKIDRFIRVFDGKKLSPQLRRKFSTQEKILNSRENYQIRKKIGKRKTEKQ